MSRSARHALVLVKKLTCLCFLIRLFSVAFLFWGLNCLQVASLRVCLRFSACLCVLLRLFAFVCVSKGLSVSVKNKKLYALN